MFIWNVNFVFFLTLGFVGDFLFFRILVWLFKLKDKKFYIFLYVFKIDLNVWKIIIMSYIVFLFILINIGLYNLKKGKGNWLEIVFV